MKMTLNQHKIKVVALWLDPTVGLKGFLGAILTDGTPVGLCSKEKWDLGSDDSLRKNWQGNIRRFRGGKVIHTDVSERRLRKDGLMKGYKLELTVPQELLSLVTGPDTSTMTIKEDTSPMTIKDLFFVLPAVNHEYLPPQRARFNGPDGNSTVILTIVAQDRAPDDRDGLVEISTEEFLNLPIVNVRGTPTLREDELKQNARNRLYTRTKRRGEGA